MAPPDERGHPLDNKELAVKFLPTNTLVLVNEGADVFIRPRHENALVTAFTMVTLTNETDVERSLGLFESGQLVPIVISMIVPGDAGEVPPGTEFIEIAGIECPIKWRQITSIFFEIEIHDGRIAQTLDRHEIARLVIQEVYAMLLQVSPGEITVNFNWEYDDQLWPKAKSDPKLIIPKGNTY